MRIVIYTVPVPKKDESALGSDEIIRREEVNRGPDFCFCLYWNSTTDIALSFGNLTLKSDHVSNKNKCSKTSSDTDAVQKTVVTTE
jgi:hypothetical protein